MICTSRSFIFDLYIETVYVLKYTSHPFLYSTKNLLNSFSSMHFLKFYLFYDRPVNMQIWEVSVEFLILKWPLRPVGLSYFQSMNIYSVNYIENTHSVIDNSVVYMRIACWPWLFVPSSTVRSGSISWFSGGGLAGFSELNIKLNILSRYMYSIQSYFRIV